MRAEHGVIAFIVGVAVFTAAAVASGANPPVAPLRECSARFESSQPYTSKVSSDDVKFGPLVLTRSSEWRRPLQASQSNPDADQWPFIMKAPVRLRAGTIATLAIAPTAQAVAAILPADAREWLPAVRLRACAASTRAHAYVGTVGPITGFGQVIGLTKPSACVAIEVWVGNQSTPLRRIVAIGRPHC